MHKPQHRIHWQLTFWIGLALCGLGAMFLLVEGTLQKRRLIQARAEHMADQVELLSMALKKESDSQSRADLLETYCATMRFHGRPGHALGVLDTSGAFYRSSDSISREQLASDQHIQALLSGSAVAARWIDESSDGLSLVVAKSIRTEQGGRVGVVYYSEWLDDILRLSRSLQLQGAGVLLVLLAAVTAVVWLFIKYKVAAPLDALLMSEYAVSRGDPSPLRTIGAVSYRDPHNEISTVCAMFSYMVTRIEEREAQGDVGARPRSLRLAVSQIENGLSNLQAAGEWIAHGGVSPDHSRPIIASLLLKGHEAGDLASELKRVLEECPEYDDVELSEDAPDDPDAG